MLLIKECSWRRVDYDYYNKRWQYLYANYYISNSTEVLLSLFYYCLRRSYLCQTNISCFLISCIFFIELLRNLHTHFAWGLNLSLCWNVMTKDQWQMSQLLLLINYGCLLIFIGNKGKGGCWSKFSDVFPRNFERIIRFTFEVK